MATRKGIDISGTYDYTINCLPFFMYVLCIMEKSTVGQNRILFYFLNSTTIRHGILFSGHVEFIPTAVGSE